MTRYELINRAADHIEQHPEQYDFMSGRVQRSHAAPHCMLARMGQLAGAAAGTGCTEIATKVLGIPTDVFYQAVDNEFTPFVSTSCVYDPRRAVAGMRRAAERYRGIPGDVRALFERETETEA